MVRKLDELLQRKFVCAEVQFATSHPRYLFADDATMVRKNKPHDRNDLLTKIFTAQDWCQLHLLLFNYVPTVYGCN